MSKPPRCAIAASNARCCEARSRTSTSNAAGAAADFLRERQRGGEIDIGDGDLNARARKRPHDRGADAARAAGDDRPAALQIELAGHFRRSVNE